MSADDINDAERSQFKPYDGPTPPNAMYAWKVKVLKQGKAQSGNDKLIIGLELTPRRSRPDEKPYKGYFLTESIAIVESMAGKLASFLDAIGVNGSAFLNSTSVEQEKDRNGNRKITKIGKWLNDGSTYVLASIQDDEYNGSIRKRINNFWPVEDAAKANDDEDEDDSEEEEEETPAPRKKAAKKAAKRAPEPEPDDDEGEEEEEEPPAKKKPAKKAAKKAAPKRSRDDDEDDAEEEDPEDDEAPF